MGCSDSEIVYLMFNWDVFGYFLLYFRYWIDKNMLLVKAWVVYLKNFRVDSIVKDVELFCKMVFGEDVKWMLFG